MDVSAGTCRLLGGTENAIPDNTTFVTVAKTATYSRRSLPHVLCQRRIREAGGFQQLSTRNGGEVVSSDSY